MNIQAAMEALVAKLREDQHEDGSWQYPFEAGTFTDAYVIILLRTLEKDDEALIEALAERLLSYRRKAVLGNSLKMSTKGI